MSEAALCILFGVEAALNTFNTFMYVKCLSKFC